MSPPDHRRGAGRRRPAPRRGAARPPAAAPRGRDRSGRPPPDDRAGRARERPAAPDAIARRARRPRRAAAPGARTGRRSTAAYLDGLLGAFDARPARRRVVRVPARSRTSTTRRPAFGAPRRRRPPPAAADAPPPLGGDDRRSVPAARRVARGGLAGRARRRGRRASTTRPARAAADRLGPAGRRDAARPRAVGAAGGLPAAPRPRGSASACAAALLRDAAAVHRRPARRSQAAARRLLHLRRDRIRVVPLAPRPAFAPATGRRGTDRRPRPTTDAAAERERLGLTERYLVYPGRYDARQDLATLLAGLASPAPRPAGRPTCPTTSPWPPRILLVGASPDDRASLARAAARQGVGECLAYAPACHADGAPALVARRPRGHPARRVRGGRAGRDRGARLRDAGRRLGRRRAARARRRRPGSSSSRATRTGWPSALRGDLGGRRASTAAWPPPRSARATEAATDVGRRGRETRAVYAEVGRRSG